MANRLDFLLIVPSGKSKVYQKLSTDFSAIEPPVWATLLATFLQDRGCSVSILDAEAELISHDEAATRIIEANPLLAVFMIYGQQPSASTQSMPAGRELCQLVNESGFDIGYLKVMDQTSEKYVKDHMCFFHDDYQKMTIKDLCVLGFIFEARKNK